MLRPEIVDGLGREALQAHIDEKRRELEAIENIPRNCWSCQHLNQSSHCLKFNATPPRPFLDDGCGEWILEFIPF